MPQAVSLSCRAQLGEAVAGRSDFEVYHMIRAFTCVALSARRLTLIELFDAVVSSDPDLAPSRSKGLLGGLPVSPQGLLRLCSNVLSVKGNGSVDFAERSMRDLLFQTQLLNEKNGHETMATMCLQQLKRAGSRLILESRARLGSLLSSISQHPFLGYAWKYWPKHYSAAESGSDTLPSRLYELIEHSVIQEYSAEELLYIEIRQISLDLALQLSVLYNFQNLGSICTRMGADASRQHRPALQPSTQEEGIVSALLWKCNGMFKYQDLVPCNILVLAPSEEDCLVSSAGLEEPESDDSWVLLPLQQSSYDERQAGISTADTHGMDIVAAKMQKVCLLTNNEAPFTASGSVLSALCPKEGFLSS